MIAKRVGKFEIFVLAKVRTKFEQSCFEEVEAKQMKCCDDGKTSFIKNCIPAAAQDIILQLQKFRSAKHFKAKTQTIT